MNSTITVRYSRRALLAFAGLLATATGFAQATFQGVGDLPGGLSYSEVRDATKVGGAIIAVGGAARIPGSTTFTSDTAVRWTAAGGLVALPDVVTNNVSTIFMTASAITRDGTIIASRAHTAAAGNNRVAVLVTNSGTTNTVLGPLPVAPPAFSAATAVSEDGSVVYGFGNLSGPQQAFRWTAATGVVPIPFLNPAAAGNLSNPAGRGCSADGSVMVGIYNSALNPQGLAFRYVEGAGVSALPLLAGGTRSLAVAVSPDGNLTLGTGDSTAYPAGELVLWNAAAGTTTPLGSPNAGWSPTNFGGMTADGSAAVMTFGSGSINATSYLRNAYGWVPLQDVLLGAGLDLTGWVVSGVLGLSPDGTLVFGRGTHNGNQEGWVAELPAGYLASYAAPAASFHGTGDLPGGAIFSSIRDATKVGGIIIGVGDSSRNPGSGTANGDTSVRWDSINGLAALPDVVVNNTSTAFIAASAITRDGTSIASRARNIAVGNDRVAVLVTNTGTTNTVLGYLPGGSLISAATSISNDSSIIYGFSRYDSSLNLQAFRWTAGTGLTAIPFLNPGDVSNVPAGRGCSADGSVLVGTSSIAGSSGNGPGGQAYRYVHGAGVSALPLLTGGTWSTALAVSPDGNLVFGSGDSPAAPGGESVLWDVAAGTANPLGVPHAGWTPSNFGGVTADGQAAVLNFFADTDSGAFLRNAHGWAVIQDVVAGAGIDLTGWALDSVIGVTPDGTLLFGHGIHNGEHEGWIAELPPGYLAGFSSDITAPVLTLPADISVVATSPAGAVVDFVATALDDVDGPVPVIYSIAPGSIFPIATTPVTVTATDGSGNIASGSFNVTVTAPVGPPVITAQPLATTVTAGNTAVFSVTATGAFPLGYQWRKGGVNISGATSDTLTIPNAQTADVGNYRVVVTNPSGSVTSTAAHLTVINQVVITLQPANVTVVSGHNTTLTVQVTGTGPFTYQWRKGGVDIPGATTRPLHLTNVTPADAGDYDVVVTNAAGSVTSNVATVTVIERPVITSAPADLTVVAGSPAVFTVSATGTAPLSYQWRKGGVDIPGATSDTLTIPNAQSADVGNYRVVITNVAGSTTSAAAHLAVINPVVITLQPASVSVIAGRNTTLRVTATGTGPLTYQWRKGGVDIPGATTNRLQLTNVSPADAGSYDVVVANAAGPVTSAAATVTVL